MKKIIIQFSLIIPLLISACNSFPGPKIKLPEIDTKEWCGNTWFPVRLNATWVYSVTNKDVKNKEVTYTITKAATSSRGVDFWVEETSDEEWAFYNGIMVGEEPMYCNKDHHLYFQQGKSNSIFLVNPVQRMQGWTGPQGFMMQYQGEEKVTVPAGTFGVAKICSFYKDKENDRIDCLYVSPEIGIVKREWKNGNDIEIKAELLRSNVKDTLKK